MDFSGWFEAYLGGQLAHVRRPPQQAAHRPHPDRPGRDAADVAISNTFGPNTLSGFKVWTDEVG